MASLPRAGGTIVLFHAAGNAVLKETENNDARLAPRKRALKAGIAASNDRHLTVNCAVRDLSATGARLRVDNSVRIPDTFELIIELDGTEINCQVMWRKANEIGVRFIGAPRIVSAKRTQVVNPLIPPQAPSLRRKPRPGDV